MWRSFEFEHAHGPLTEPMVVRARRQFAAELGVGAAGEAFADRFPETDDGSVGHLRPDLESAISPDPEVVARGPELRALMSRLKRSDDPMVHLAMETLEHFALFVPGKVIRALSDVAAEGPGDQQSEANGSGKAALLGLERMESAWRTLVDAHHVTPRDAAPFLAEIGRLQGTLQRRSQTPARSSALGSMSRMRCSASKRLTD